MSTMTAPRRSVKSSRAATFSAELVSLACRINGAAYHVEPIPAGECGTVAFRLSKHDDVGSVYDVIRTHRGTVECDCPDYEARHRGNGLGMCKHGRALVGLGMVPAPKGGREVPTVAPAPVEPIAVPEPAGLSSPIDARTLPTIHGAGLTLEELARVTKARNTARSVYAQDARDASPGELDRVADRAATDALRGVLRDCPAAPALVAEVPACCSPAEPAPCKACVPVAELAPAIDPGDVDGDPETWGAEWDADVWNLGPEPDDPDANEEPAEAEAPALLTLPELIEQEVARMRRFETHAHDLMAKALGDLAGTVRFLNARTPGDVSARLEVLEQDDREPEPVPELTSAGTWA